MNHSSTEDYLDSLLWAIQQKDNSEPEPQVHEPEIEEPEMKEVPELLEEAPQKQEYFIPSDEPTVLDILSGDPNKPLSAEEIQAMFAQAEETLVEEMSAEEFVAEEIPVEKLMQEEMPVEQLMAEELPIDEFVAKEIPTEEIPTEEIPIEEILTEEISTGEVDFDGELPPLEEVLGRMIDEEAVDLSVFDAQMPAFEEKMSVSDEQNLQEIEEDLNLDELFGGQIVEEVVEEPPVLTGQEMFADEIQSLSEDDILNLLQQSSDLESDDISIDALFGEESATADLDLLLENMNDDSDIAGLQDLFGKSENNVPVSSEVEEMIELGLKVEEEPFEVQPEDDSKPGFFGKLKGKLFSKKNKQKEESSDSAGVIENAAAGENDNAQEDVHDENVDISELQSFSNDSNMDEFVNLTEGATGLEDLMAETGALDFGGMSNNTAETFSFDQLFVDTSNVQAENSEMSDISDLLNSLESAEGQANIFDAGDDLFASMNSEEGLETIEGLLEGTEEEPKKEKKPGLFSRLITFLTVEDEEEESNGLSGDGVEKLGVTSEENKEALEQLDKEGDGKKKKKKKGKKDETADEELEEDEEPQDDKKNKKKAKKEKKQKEPKIVEDVNEPVLSKKKVRSTFLFAFTIMAAILVFCLFVPDLFEKKSARNAFYDGDYETCYQSLYGKKLSESDRLIFEQAGFMLALERRVDSYDNYMAVGDELRALESLIQEVAKQDEVMKQAENYKLTAEAEQSYQEVLNILSERYQVSEADALMINGYKQDALYTLHLKTIVAGEEFVCPDYLREDAQVPESVENDENSVEEGVGDTLEDMLPAEEELTETEFEEGTN